MLAQSGFLTSENHLVIFQKREQDARTIKISSQILLIASLFTGAN